MKRIITPFLLAGLLLASPACSWLKSTGSALLADLANCTGKEIASQVPQLAGLVSAGNQSAIEAELTGALGQDTACTLNAMATTSTPASSSPALVGSAAPSLAAQASAAIKLAISHGKLTSSPKAAACTSGCVPASTAPAPVAAPAVAAPPAVPSAPRPAGA